MAPIFTPSTSEVSQQSILSLDKSTEPFHLQIDRICNLLDITLRELSIASFTDNVESTLPKYCGPREEWALRWLLKGMENSDLEPGSPCVEYRAWLLLRELILRTTAGNTARLLDTHNFMGVLYKIFHWMHERIGDIENPPSEEALNITESSSTTVETPSIEAKKKSRKRKRSEPQLAESCFPHKANSGLEPLYRSICSCVIQLQKLSTCSASGHHGFAVEHLKSALKSTPEQAAAILQNSVLLESQIITKELNDLTEDEFGVVDACLSSMVQIWESRSVVIDNPPDPLSKFIFSDHCIAPILTFLSTCQALSSSYLSVKGIIKSLEGLLVQNILLPARADFFVSKKSHNAHNEESNPTAGFLDPLSKMNRFTSREYLKRQSNDVALLPIPLLFDIAIRCLPRVTPMQRSLEDSWLQDLFSKLVRYASAEIASPPPDLGSEQYTLNLIQMLQKISDHKIRLATSKLETVLAAVVKNVENERDTPAHWDLIAACLDVDANVLISPSVAEAIQQTPDEPNRHLASLISCVATSTWKSSPGTSSYEVKLWKFIIPLASAFAKARNLTSFLSIWQEQLVQCQNEQTLNKTSLSATVYAPNVWEDERLSELVSRLVETTLTAGQIENLLQKAQEGVFLFEVKHSGVHSKLEAYLVILDCLINVRLSQSNLDQLAKMLSRVYTSISDTVSNTYDWPTEHKWRLWRVLITIDEHWLLPRESSDIRVAEQLGLSRAISISTQESSNKDIQIKSNILEDVYSFMFILNLASVHAKNNAAWQVSICQLVYKAVEDFLDHQEALCHAREPDLNTANQVARFLIQWDGKINTICSAEVASLVCIWNILMHPNILSNIKTDKQKAFYRQIYLGAITISNSCRATNENSIHYLSVWNKLLKSNMLQEKSLSTAIFREFQTSIFIDSAFQISSFTNYEIAFTSLQHTPVRAFKRSQKQNIIKRILQVLTKYSLPNRTLVVDHINLLSRHVEAAGHPLILLNIWKGDSVDRVYEGLSTDEAPLIGIARNLKNHEGANSSLDALTALKRLVDITLRSCLPTITHDQTIEQVVLLFQHVVESFHKDSEPSRDSAFSTLLIASSEFYSTHIAKLPDLSRRKFSDFYFFRLDLSPILYGEVCETISLIRKDGTNQQDNMRDLGFKLKLMASCADILKHPDLSAALPITSGIKKGFSLSESRELLNEADHDPSNEENIFLPLLRIEAVLATTDNDTSSILRALNGLRHLQSSQAKFFLIGHLVDAIASFAQEHQSELISILSKEDHSGFFDPNKLIILDRMILVMHKGTTTQLGSINDALLSTYSSLCNRILQSTEFRVSILAMRIMSILLQKEQQMISQWHVDNTVAMITVAASRLKSFEKEKHAAMSYICLCRIFRTVLMMHRTKLGGRHHLVVSALQMLLQCLYIPYTKEQKVSAAKRENSMFGEDHAAAYCGLLTMICDPSVSAVTRARKRPQQQELNDLTQKARSIAGQHLHYLIMEYCQCQLKGSLRPGMKKALTPGLYAILNVMSQDVKQTMNAALDASSRSVFKALYEDYRRFGKWQGT